MTRNTKTLAWREYEAGKEYKRSIGLYESIRQNERFYRGEQWNSEATDLPKPVFNFIRRIIDYLVASISLTNVSVRYLDESIPFVKNSAVRDALGYAIDTMNKNVSYRWERTKMDSLIRRILLDAAIAGDGVLYSYWDPDIKTGQAYTGDIVTEAIDNVNLFVADVNVADIQSQDYIILAGRKSVGKLRAEAKRAGCPDKEIAKITPDNDTSATPGDMSSIELSGDEEAKATFLIKFWRENGLVVWEKSTRECVISRQSTPLRLYPVAYFNWISTKGSFHGTSPITGLIPNQKFINRAYAMVMKHMTDSAFSKVIYDKSKIPEWSNEIGQAIGAVGGGNVSDAVSVVGTGQMQKGYLELIDSAITVTKELMGATDVAMGNVNPVNTSAILALQEVSEIPIRRIRDTLYQCIEDMANIWADMMCAYYSDGRLLPYEKDGVILCDKVDFSLLRQAMLHAFVEVGAVSKYSVIASLSMLDKLLEGGYITFEEYLERIPDNLIVDKKGLMK